MNSNIYSSLLFGMLFPPFDFGIFAHFEWEQWEASCQEMITDIGKDPMIIGGTTKCDMSELEGKLFKLMRKMKEIQQFSLENDCEQKFKQRMDEPLNYAIAFCDKLNNGTKGFTPITDEALFNGLMPKIRSIILAFQNNFDLFRLDVELKIVETANFPSGTDYYGRLSKFSALLERNRDFMNMARLFEDVKAEFVRMIVQFGIKTVKLEDAQFRHALKQFIIGAELSILEKELDAKLIAVAKPRIDKSAFMEFSYEFVLKWRRIDEEIKMLPNVIKMKGTLIAHLNKLAQIAMLKTLPLKECIAEKLDGLIRNCNKANEAFEKTLGNKKLKGIGTDGEEAADERQSPKQKEEAIGRAKKDYKKLMLQMLSDIGMPMYLNYGCAKRMENAENEMNAGLKEGIGKLAAFEDLRKVLEAEKAELQKAFKIPISMRKCYQSSYLHPDKIKDQFSGFK